MRHVFSLPFLHLCTRCHLGPPLHYFFCPENSSFDPEYSSPDTGFPAYESRLVLSSQNRRPWLPLSLLSWFSTIQPIRGSHMLVCSAARVTALFSVSRDRFKADPRECALRYDEFSSECRDGQLLLPRWVTEVVGSLLRLGSLQCLAGRADESEVRWCFEMEVQ